MSPQYSADSFSDNEPQEDVQSSLSRLQSSLLSRPYFACLVRWNAADANAEPAMCSDGEAVQASLNSPKSGDVYPTQPDKSSAIMLLWWAVFFHLHWRQTGEMMKAAVHEPRAHSVGLCSGCRLFQRKVRATYLRWPPCRKKIMSMSVSNSAVTKKDFPWLVCKRRQIQLSLD